MLRIALVVPGAVSLGSYEAGALSALSGAISAHRGRVVVDVVAGASAGAITGMLFARTLLGGDVSDLERLWLERTDLAELLASGHVPGRPRAPLGTASLEGWASAQLGAGLGEPVQDEPIAFVVSMANLQGLGYRFSVRRDPDQEPIEIDTDTFADWKRFELSRFTDWTDPSLLDAVVSSAANAFAFAPVQIERRRDEYGPRLRFPVDADAAAFWYTDGGTIDNAPLGRALDALADPPDSDDSRLVLLLTPHPTKPPDRWPWDRDMPTFVGTALRAQAIQRSQSLFGDLRRLEKTNTHIAWRRRLAEALTTLPTEHRAELARIGREAAADRAGLRGETVPTLSDDEAVAALLDTATGTRGKIPIDLAIVSPDLEPGTTPEELLAGEIAGHFGGFASADARAADFGLGYRHMAMWWELRRVFVPSEGFDPLPPHPDRRDQVPPMGSFAIGDIGLTRLVGWGTRLGWRYLRELARALRG